MPIDKDILKTAIGNLRKELRGYKGPVVISVETSADEPDGDEGTEPEGDEKPDLLAKAMSDLKG